MLFVEHELIIFWSIWSHGVTFIVIAIQNSSKYLFDGNLKSSLLQDTRRTLRLREYYNIGRTLKVIGNASYDSS